MRIVYLCADRGIPVRGHKGASVHVRSVTEAFQASGHHVTLLCARRGTGNPDPRVAHIIEAGADDSRVEAELTRLLATGSIDLVIERYSLESGMAGPLCAQAGVPHVLEVNAPFVLEAARYRNLENVDTWLRREAETFRSTRFITVVSTELERYVRDVAPDAAVTVIPNGVDVERFGPGPAMDLGLPPQSVVIGFVGSMKPWHGVEDLVAASRPVLERHPQAALVLAGEGPQARSIRDQVASSGMSGQTHILGAVEHDRVPSLLRSIDVAAAPYRPSHDFYFSPLKVLEYMASGCATVYPALGDLPAIVSHGGLAYPPGDVSALEGALETLVGDVTAQNELGRYARQRALELTWDKVVRSIEWIVHPARVRAARSA